MHQKPSPPELEGRSLYGFVEAIEPPLPENTYSRFALMLDAVNAEAFDNNPTAVRQAKNLSIIRIISTPQRVLDFFGTEIPPEGKWIRLVLGRRANSPPAWILNADNDFSGPIIRTNVISLETLPDPGGRTSQSRTVTKLERSCEISPQGSRVNKIGASTPTLGRFHIRVIDVGHASFAAIHSGVSRQSPIVGYFDAGAPAFFHLTSFPKSFNEASSIPKSGFVVLSHWDFDHYSLAATRLKDLQKLDWYAPHQKVGPNAANFQRDLGPRLHFINRTRIPVANGLTLHRGTAPPSDRNNSGYVMCLEQGREKILLTADVGYSHMGTALKGGLTGVSVPHHGGNGSAPPPNGNGIAVVSYGVPNRYRHPVENNLTAHGHAGWNVRRTAAHGFNSRGDRWLTAP